jgi:hypothetical protein
VCKKDAAVETGIDDFLKSLRFLVKSISTLFFTAT